MNQEVKRRALGRGLSSLIPDATEIALDANPSTNSPADFEPTTSVTDPARRSSVALDRIRPNPRQPRRHFDDAEIEALAQSIRQSGVLQPLLVRAEADGSFTLVAGERRLRAAGRAGLTEVPVTTRDVADDQLLEIALIENLQRDDLGPLETAQALRSLVRDLRLTQNEVAERIGKPRSSVANFLRLLDLPEPVQRLLNERKLEMGHGRALAGLDKEAQQISLATAAAEGGWSVRQVEDRVRRVINGEADSSHGEVSRIDPNVASAEKTLSRALGAKVFIRGSRGSRGKIEIRFAGEEDLDRLYRLLLRGSGSASNQG